jgi:hypothetical protein
MGRSSWSGGRHVELGDAVAVPTAFVIGGQEHGKAIPGGLEADDSGAEREHVRVVVLAAQPGGGDVVA